MSSAATVTFLKGAAFAVRNGQRIPLSVGSELTSADEVHTETGAKLEMRFKDGAIVDLGSSTRVALKDFSFDPEGRDEPSFVMDMMGGVVRSVSGKVVEQNPEAFKLTSPLGIVGIRGTETLHKIFPKFEIHVIVNLDGGHTVVFSTPDGRSIVVSDSFKGVHLTLGDGAPLHIMEIPKETIEEMLHQTRPDAPPVGDGLSSLFVAMDAAALSEQGEPEGFEFSPVEFFDIFFLAVEALDLTDDEFEDLDFEEVINSLLALNDFAPTSSFLSSGIIPSGPGLTPEPASTPAKDPASTPAKDPASTPAEEAAPTPAKDPATESGQTPTPTTTPEPIIGLILYGTAGDDVLTGNEGDNLVYGYKGNDLITVMGGKDTVYGGFGSSDTIIKTGLMLGGALLVGDEETLPAGTVADNDLIEVRADMEGGTISGDGINLGQDGSPSGIVGGDDSIKVQGIMSGGIIYGDAANLENADGGDDLISVAGMTGGEIYGDAENFFSGQGGNDTISITGVMSGGSIYGDAGSGGAYNGGDDLISVENFADGGAILLDGGGGVNTLAFGSGANNVLIWENQLFFGPDGADSRTQPVEYSGFSVFDGAAGNDTLAWNKNMSSGETLSGGSGDDLLSVSVMRGGAVYGDYALPGSGEGDDTVVVHQFAGSDSITLDGGGGSNALSFGDGRDNITLERDSGGSTFFTFEGDDDNMRSGSVIFSNFTRFAGGDGQDTLILKGNWGSSSLALIGDDAGSGLQGSNDVIDVGTGAPADSIAFGGLTVYGDFEQILYGAGGDDSISLLTDNYQQISDLTIYGDAYSISGSSAFGGNDVITIGNDTPPLESSLIYGDAYSIVGGSGGDDSIYLLRYLAHGQRQSGVYGDAEIMTDASGGNDYIENVGIITGTSENWLTISGDGMEFNNSAGGDDSLSFIYLDFSSVYGDAYSISGGSGGDDIIEIKTLDNVNVYGDGHSLRDGAAAGADFISVTNMNPNSTIYGDGHSGLGAYAGADHINVKYMNNGTIYGDFAEFYDLRGIVGGSGNTIEIDSMYGGAIHAGNYGDSIRIGQIASGGEKNIYAGNGADTISLGVPTESSGQILNINGFDAGSDKIKLDDFSEQPIVSALPGTDGDDWTFTYTDNVNSVTVNLYNAIGSQTDIQNSIIDLSP